MKTVSQIIGLVLLTFSIVFILGIIISSFVGQEKERVINTPILNIRNGPGPEFEKVGEKQRGDMIEVTKDSAGWVQFIKETSGNDTLLAWVKKEYTVKQGKWEKIKEEKREEERKTEREKADKALKEKKGSEPQKRKSPNNSTPNIGEIVKLKHDAAPSFIATSEAWDAMTEAVNASDKVGLKRLIRQNKVAWVKDDRKAKILDMGMTSYKIRITNGPNSGTAGWVYRELITGK